MVECIGCACHMRELSIYVEHVGGEMEERVGSVGGPD